MKQLALEALDSAQRPGVTYADVRIIESRDRELGTKNGKPGQVSSDESVGIGIRVLADGCWGFAATDDLTRPGVESAAALAVDIARSSALAKKHDVTLAPESKHEATWVSPCRIDPFSVPVEEQLSLLTSVDEELRRAPRSHARANVHDLPSQPPNLRLFHRQRDRSNPHHQRRRI